MTRRASRTRNGPPRQTAAFRNRLLLALPPADRDALLSGAAYVTLPVGQTYARAGDPIVSAYFLDNGVISLVSEMTTGHQVAVAALGEEGLIGLGSLFEKPAYTHTLMVLIESQGYQITAGRPVVRVLHVAGLAGGGTTPYRRVQTAGGKDGRVMAGLQNVRN